jgi:hypothetical protein
VFLEEFGQNTFKTRDPKQNSPPLNGSNAMISLMCDRKGASICQIESSNIS